MSVKLGLAKFQPFSARKTFSNWGLNEGV